MKVGTPDNSVTEAKRPQKMNRRGRNKIELDDGYEEAYEIVGEKMMRGRKQYLNKQYPSLHVINDSYVTYNQFNKIFK